MKDVHTLGSATYHQWITPEQFGARFGAADSDIQTVVSWITSKGFQMTRVSKSKTLIEFSGTFGQISEAFHTAIHRYEVNGELHYANATDPQIPEALAGIVRGLSPLHDFHARPRTSRSSYKKNHSGLRVDWSQRNILWSRPGRLRHAV
jgi:subtilase family serine protease